MHVCKLAASCLNPRLIFQPSFRASAPRQHGETSVVLSCQAASSEKPNLSHQYVDDKQNWKKKKSPCQPSLNQLFFPYKANMRHTHGHQRWKESTREWMQIWISQLRAVTSNRCWSLLSTIIPGMFPLRELSPSGLRSSRDLICCQPDELMFSQHLPKDFCRQQKTKRLGVGRGGEGVSRELESEWEWEKVQESRDEDEFKGV